MSETPHYITRYLNARGFAMWHCSKYKHVFPFEELTFHLRQQHPEVGR